jgi:hypothetical protein
VLSSFHFDVHGLASHSSILGNQDAPVIAHGVTLSAVENSSIAERPSAVATFTDPGGIEDLSHYSAEIDWGDQTNSSGAIAVDASTGVFTVLGSHQYAEEGSYLLHITIHDRDSADAMVTSLVNVADPSPVATGGFSFAAIEGIFSDSQVVATFTDPAGPAPLDEYHASIDWGDGARSDGEISSLPDGSFAVKGAHEYIEEGSKNITVVIEHERAHVSMVQSTAQVADQPVAATGGFTIQSVEGSSTDAATLATFTGPADTEELGEYSATIEWGDGTQSDGQIMLDDGVFSVRGGHLFAEEGSFPVSVSIHHGTAAAVVVESRAEIADAPLAAQGGIAFAAIEGIAFENQLLATFTDRGPSEDAANYSATIEWGDGNQSEGEIRADDGHFSVIGGHAYAEEGSYRIRITIHHETANDVVTSCSASVSDAGLDVQGGLTVFTTEGSTFDNQTVATFTDRGGAEDPSLYTATIDWGDGIQSDGQIMPSGTGFSVTGGHRYAEEGNYAIRVAVHHSDLGDGIGISQATVSDAPVAAQGGIEISAVEGVAFDNHLVATFTDPAGTEEPADYSATIDWGDGNQTAGIIGANGASFSVTGGHLYAEEGSYSIHVTIHHGSAADVSVDSTAHVSDVAVIAQGGFLVQTAEGVRFDSEPLATFTDPSGAEDPTRYSATVDWGDGSQSSGQIGFANGAFTVSGGHTYSEEGEYRITVTVHHEGAADVSVPSNASVSDLSVVAQGDFHLQGVEGNPITGQMIARFNDPGGADDPAEYSARIDWGDGDHSDGVIAVADDAFVVLGTHTYTHDGNYSVRVTIHHGSAADVLVHSDANIAEAALTRPAGTSNSVTEGDLFNGVLASFRDQNAGATAATFAADIDWGDGIHSAGTIGRNADGSFSVVGSHAYSDDGSFTAQVKITDDVANITALSQFTVGAVAPSLTFAGPTFDQAGSPYVLHFTSVEHGTDHLASVTINWDDGTVQTVPVNSNATSLDITHVYTDAPNFYTITASFADEDGTHTSASSQNVVVLVPGINPGDFSTAVSSPDHPGVADLQGTVAATLSLPNDANQGDSAKLFIGRYHQDPVPVVPTGNPVGFTDVHLQFHVQGQPDGTLSVSYIIPDKIDAQSFVPQFFDGTKWQAVSPESRSISTDSQGRRSLTIILGIDTVPTLAQLTHTVFTIAVVTPAPATNTAIVPPLVLANTGLNDLGNGFQSTATFVQSNQLTLALSASQGRSESGGGENREQESGGDDPLLGPLQLLLTGEQQGDRSQRQIKKPAVVPSADKPKAGDAAPPKPATGAGAEPGADQTPMQFQSGCDAIWDQAEWQSSVDHIRANHSAHLSIPPTGGDLVEALALADSLSSAVPDSRDQLFDNASIDSKLDFTLDSALAAMAAVVFASVPLTEGKGYRRELEPSRQWTEREGRPRRSRSKLHGNSLNGILALDDR